jgi:hypothetical protein
MKETFISTIAYEEDFRSNTRAGWGCGYVHIPEDHPILVKLIDNEGWGDYLQPDDCPEEITFSRWDKDKEYYVIGFDTAHSYNDSAIHNEVYVTAQANAIKSLVDNYTAYDAHAYATKQIQLAAKNYSKYLLS